MAVEILLINGPSAGRTYKAEQVPTAWEVMGRPNLDDPNQTCGPSGLYYPISDLSRTGYDVPPLRARTDEWLFLWDGWR